MRCENLKYAFVIFVTILSTRLWSYQGISKNVYDVAEVIVICIMAAIVVTNNDKISKINGAFKCNVFMFILLPVVSAFAAYMFHDQPLSLSLLVTRTGAYYLLYLILHLYDIPIKRIKHLMIFVGAAWVLLTIVQQYTYPRFWFYIRSGEEGEDFYRLGIYRFMLKPHQYAIFILLFFYNRFLLTKKKLNMLAVVFGMLGFYYYGTRQYAIAAVVCISLATILQGGKAKFASFLWIGIISILLFSFGEMVLSGYIEMTMDQMEPDDIRIQSAKYYLLEYWPSWVSLLIGNGREHLDSGYGKEVVDRLCFYAGLCRCDVGIVGAFNTYGIFYVLNILHMNFKGLKSWYCLHETRYLRLIFLNSVILLPISEYYSEPSAIPFYCFIMYLVDKSFQQKALQNVDNEMAEIKRDDLCTETAVQ